MRRWGTIPFGRIFLPLVAGILYAIFLPPDSFLPPFLFFLGLMNIFIRLLYGKYFPRSAEWITGMGFALCWLSAGMMRVSLENDLNFSKHYSYFPSITALQGSLSDELHHKARSYKTTFRVEAVRDSMGYWHRAHGQLLLYVAKTEKAARLMFNDRLLIMARPRLIENPQNPEEFNYKRYLYFHNIYGQVYATDSQWIRVEAGKPSLRGFAFELRQQLIETLKRLVIRRQEVAVASALVLGFRDDLDIEQKRAFASAGALHVLAVSGMHVGILFFIMSQLLTWIERIKTIRWLKHILLLVFIWFYAMLTGFSPSVMRASVMISVMIAGQLISRKGNIYNTMMLAACLLLMVNPFMITEVGFQLSFLAVFGIVALHPIIFRWIEPTHWVLHKIWEITSVSLAAQIMTFPLGLLYFHQFPLLFFISNLMVIPLAFIIMISTLALFLISHLPVPDTIGMYAGILVFAVIYLLNQSVLVIDGMATSVIRGITISVGETWLIYLIILFLFLFIVTRNHRHLQWALAAIIVLLAVELRESFHQARQQYFVCYSVKGYPAYGFIDGRNYYLLSHDSLLNNENLMLFHIRHHQWASGAINVIERNVEDNFTSGSLTRFSSSAVFGNHRFYFLRSFPEQEGHAGAFTTDFLILSNGGYYHAASLRRCVRARHVILDATFSEGKARQLASLLEGMNVHQVSRSGAFVANLRDE
jgi:competence protein ComEC